MENGIFKLGWHDLFKGLIVAVFSSVFIAIQHIIATNGFSFTTADAQVIASGALVSVIGYLAKQLITTDEGTVLGVNPNK